MNMKALVIFLITSFSISFFSFSGRAISNPIEKDKSELCLRDSIVSYAQEYVGVPYVWGGATTEGFDCTGFVYYVFKKFGIHVSRASSGYENFGEKDHTKKKVGHAGIVLQNEGGLIDFIHSSSSKNHFGVTITRYNASGYVKRFLRVIKVL